LGHNIQVKMCTSQLKTYNIEVYIYWLCKRQNKSSKIECIRGYIFQHESNATMFAGTRKFTDFHYPQSQLCI